MRLFLSVPFSSKVDSKGIIDKAFKSDIEILIQNLEEDGHKVYCAPAAEKWKISHDNPVKVLSGDLDKIAKTDVYIAILDNEISAGVQISMGFALANQKRIVMASPTGVKLSWANNAVSGFQNVSSLNFSFYDELAEQILELITR